MILTADYFLCLIASLFSSYFMDSNLFYRESFSKVLNSNNSLNNG